MMSGARITRPMMVERPVIPVSRDEYFAEVARLRGELETARATVFYLRGLLMAPLAFPRDWRLTGSETRMLAALVRHPSGLSKPALHAALTDRDDPDSELKIVDVFICKLRAKLRRHAFKIETMWGAGYRLAPESLAAIIAALPPPMAGKETA